MLSRTRALSVCILIASFSALLLVQAAPALAQVWNEAGDAGDLIATAQTTIGSGGLTQINGTLSSPTDVDIYCFQAGPAIRVFGHPILGLQCSVNAGPDLYVFDSNGVGLTTNETCSMGEKLLTTATLGIPSNPAQFYVAVAYSGMNPVTSVGSIWQTGVPGERMPDGTDPTGVLAGWSGTGNVQPINPYTIVLGAAGGVSITFCDDAVPALEWSWSTLKGLYE